MIATVKFKFYKNCENIWIPLTELGLKLSAKWLCFKELYPLTGHKLTSAAKQGLN